MMCLLHHLTANANIPQKTAHSFLLYEAAIKQTRLQKFTFGFLLCAVLQLNRTFHLQHVTTSNRQIAVSFIFFRRCIVLNSSIQNTSRLPCHCHHSSHLQIHGKVRSEHAVSVNTKLTIICLISSSG